MLDCFMGVDVGRLRIGGSKVPTISVDAHLNSTAAEVEKEEKLKQATWRASYRSGGAVLVIAITMASVWASLSGVIAGIDRRVDIAAFISQRTENFQDC